VQSDKYTAMTSTNDLDDKRRLKRFIVNVKIFNSDTGELLGYSANMHAMGMKITSTEEIPLHTEFNVKIEHIRIDDDEFVEIPLCVRSLWGGPGKNPDFIDTGFQIIDPTPESERAITALIEELSVEKNLRPGPE
jgi:hypothetical protein